MRRYLFWGIESYPTFLVLGIIVGAAVAFRGARRRGLDMRRVAFSLALCGVAALIGSKLSSLIERSGFYYLDGEPTSAYQELIYGYRYAGGLLGLVAGIAVVALDRKRRLPAPAFADVIAPAFAFAMGITRLGCFLTGCCSGHLCELPWALRFPAPSKAWMVQVRDGLIAETTTWSLAVHPLQLYFAITSFAVGAFLLWLAPRKTYDGQVFLAFVAIHGGTKAAIEMLRYDYVPQVPAASAAFAVVAAAILLGRFLAVENARRRTVA